LLATFEEGLRDRPLAFLTLLESAFVAVVRDLAALIQHSGGRPGIWRAGAMST
jgi:hypothetical protein